MSRGTTCGLLYPPRSVPRPVPDTRRTEAYKTHILRLISKVHINSYYITVESLLYFTAISKADGGHLQDTKWIVSVILERYYNC